MSPMESSPKFEKLFNEIIEKENLLTQAAQAKFDEWLDNATDWIVLMHDGLDVEAFKPDSWIFSFFWTQVKKHLCLAQLSALRQHHIQAMMDLRQALEAGSWAALALQKPEIQLFAVTSETDGRLAEVPINLKKRMYKWLDEASPEMSKTLHNLKDLINESCGHSNLIYAFKNYDHKGGFSFFDQDNNIHVKGDLWFGANVARGLLYLWYEINEKGHLIDFVSDYKQRYSILATQQDKLKIQLLPCLPNVRNNHH